MILSKVLHFRGGGVSGKREAIRLIQLAIPVRQIESGSEFAGADFTSPWDVTVMTPASLLLDRKADLMEVVHELGHCVEWVARGRPPGNDWGFAKPDRYALETTERELLACCVGLAFEMKHHRSINFEHAVIRMMEVYNFGTEAMDAGLSEEAWTRRALDDGRKALETFVENCR